METFDAACSTMGEPYDYRASFSAPHALAEWLASPLGTVNPREDEILPPRVRRSRQDGDRFTVLIVDDDESIAELLADLLAGEGYRAVIAHDGLAALDYARAHRPDMIISDCMMPGLSGTQLAQELRRHSATRSIALVLMSSTRPQGLNLAHVPFLAKPFEIDDVLALVEHQCRGPVAAQLYGEG